MAADHINELPTELLTEVMRLVGGPLSTTALVCKRWYYAVMLNPILWSHIHIADPQAIAGRRKHGVKVHKPGFQLCTSKSRLRSIIERSGSSSLHLFMEPTVGAIWDSRGQPDYDGVTSSHPVYGMLQILLETSSKRLLSLEIDPEGYLDRPFAWPFTPNLHALIVRGREMDWGENLIASLVGIIEHSPSLRLLNLADLIVDDVLERIAAGVSVPQLRTFQINESTIARYPLERPLLEFPNSRHVECLDVDRRLVEFGSDSDGAFYPSLKRLRMNRSWSGTWEDSYFSSLEELELIHTDLGQPPNGEYYTFPNLASLTVQFPIHKRKYRVPKLRRLRLQFSVRRGGSDLVDLWEDQIGRLQMKKVEWLHLEYLQSFQSFVRIAEVFEQAKTLVVSGFSSQPFGWLSKALLQKRADSSNEYVPHLRALVVKFDADLFEDANLERIKQQFVEELELGRPTLEVTFSNDDIGHSVVACECT